MPSLDRPEDDPSAIEEPRNRPSRRTVTLIVTPIIILVICGWIGDASAAYLVDHHPVWLIALNARNRNLLLVTNYVDAAPYYVVGTLRLLLSDPLFYLLGFIYGDAAVRWMESKAPTYGKLMRSAESFFTIAAYPLVFFAPNNFICLFAGAAGMSVPVFFVLNISGTIVRLYALRVTGDIFNKPIQRVLEFIRDYRVPLLVLSVLLVLFTIWNERRQGGTEIEALTHLDEELGVADDEDAG
jgi:membrane protein DedA with SNARE-associated domain